MPWTNDSQGSYGVTVKNDRRLRCLVAGEARWYWLVRQRVKPVYEACGITLSFHPRGARGCLMLVFRPAQDRIISNSYFDSGALIRLPDRIYLNLYEPGTVRRLLDAAASELALDAGRTVEVDGWPYFDAVVDSAGTARRIGLQRGRSPDNRAAKSGSAAPPA